MTDQYGAGRWGTGPRPTSPGMDQSNYDQGVAVRRAEEMRREREQREYYDKQREKDRKRQEEERRRLNDQYSSGPSPSPTINSDDDLEFQDYLRLAVIGGFTYLLIKVWGMLTGSWSPSNGILAAIANHGVWGVGALGIYLSLRLDHILMPIAKIILGLAVLFFGSAIAYGIYQGITN